jgi:hypothetical protein
MRIDGSIFSMIDPRCFCQLECIHTLTWECVCLSFVTEAVTTYVRNPLILFKLHIFNSSFICDNILWIRVQLYKFCKWPQVFHTFIIRTHIYVFVQTYVILFCGMFTVELM